MKNTCKQFKFSLNPILPTLFTLRDDESKIIAVMSSNVDDLLYGYLPQAGAMNSVLQQFLVGKEEHCTFRFCGKEFEQDEDFGIHVTAKDNIERVQPITYDGKHGLTRKATANGVHQLRSVAQFLAWVARQTRLDFSYHISKIQSTFENSCVRDLRECNRIVEYATSTSTAMLSDCLTMTMTSSRLNETLSTGIFDMRPTEESLAIKAKNRKWRASKKEQERLQDPDD